MFLAYYVVVAAIAFWAISTHDQTKGRPFLSIFGAAVAPITLPLIPIAGLSYWAYKQLKIRQALKTDEGIRHLIVACARNKGIRLNCPSLRYKRISDFASGNNGDCEWFPNHVGMRFWVKIEGLVYAVNVETIDPNRADKSGVVISARLDNSPVTVQ